MSLFNSMPMKKPLPIAAMLVLLSAMLILPIPVECAGADTATGTTAVTRVVAVIPPDAPPTYFLDQQTGKPAGFAVDVMDEVASRAGLKVVYVFEDGWSDIIEMVKNGKADLAPGMGISNDREKDLAFSELIDTFPISFFVRSDHRGIDATLGIHTVGTAQGSVASEYLRHRGDVRLVFYESYPNGLFDLLSGKLEAFAGPAPTLWQLARDARVDDHIKVVDMPIAEIRRAIAVRKDKVALLGRLNEAISSFMRTRAYQQIYTKWYGKPVPYWSERRIVMVGAVLVLVSIAFMAGWRHVSVLRLNRELTKIIKQSELTEEALRNSNAFNQSIIDSSNDCIKILDLEGRLQYMSPGGQHILGIRSMEKYMKVPYEDFWKGSDHAAAREAISKACEGNTGTFQGFCPTVDGTPKWWDVVISPIIGNNGKSERLLVVSRDITEQRRVQESLKSNQNRLESLVNIAQRRSENTQELLDFALEEAIRLTRSGIGYIYLYNEEKQEFTLNTWSREVMKECAIAEPQTIYKLEKTGIWGEAVRQRKPIVLQDFHAPHQLKKGYPEGHVPLNSFLTVPVYQKDQIVAVVGVANKQAAYDQDDISQLTLMMDSVWRMVEHKKIETALRENEAVLRSFLNAITESALLMDREGRVLAANETVAKRLGSPGQGIIGRNLYDLLPPDVAQKRKVRLDAVFHTGVPDRFEDERLGKVIDNSVYPVFGPQGAVTALAIVGIDITDRKLAAQEREKLIAELQKALNEIKTLHGILPICASCKKIRDDKGAWQHLEAYISQHTDAEFSHGLCSDCAKKLYPEYMNKKE